ncbi:hypothetical protein D6810_01530 [Candidatus Dojkabacteria bacterium]|uniref:Uncharacterized protein n=1 Tax=Candidatus Dojkabacteria bacterium TaxID=2099670 RepID=A0A3M0Z2F4_9BACT|nr:MAG: hypothetical protein D6810_01530 [Candidatus Dojkabacteria bacterium]
MKKFVKKFLSIIPLVFVFLFWPGFFTVDVNVFSNEFRVVLPVELSAAGSNNQGSSGNVLCKLFPLINSVASSFCAGGNDSAIVEGAASDAANLIRFALQLVFVGIVGVAIYVIVKAALKYIRSEGEKESVEQARAAIKTVFAGIAALFVGIVGLVLVIAFFNASGALNVGESSGIRVIDTFKDSLLDNN